MINVTGIIVFYFPSCTLRDCPNKDYSMKFCRTGITLNFNGKILRRPFLATVSIESLLLAHSDTYSRSESLGNVISLNKPWIWKKEVIDFKLILYARSEVLPAVFLKMHVVWDVMACRLIDSYRRFGVKSPNIGIFSFYMASLRLTIRYTHTLPIVVWMWRGKVVCIVMPNECFEC